MKKEPKNLLFKSRVSFNTHDSSTSTADGRITVELNAQKRCKLALFKLAQHSKGLTASQLQEELKRYPNYTCSDIRYALMKLAKANIIKKVQHVYIADKRSLAAWDEVEHIWV